MISRLDSVSLKGIGLPLLAVLIVFLLKFSLVFSKGINWDEFIHFSEIHAYARGETVKFMQLPFTRLYYWVLGLGSDNIHDIIIIRALNMGFVAGVLALIYLCARRFTNIGVSILAALLYLTAGYAFLHGFALRADIIAAFLSMSALAVALRGKITWYTVAIVCVLVGLSFFSTIKTVLYAPAFLAALYLRRNEINLGARPLMWLGMIALIVAAAAIAALYASKLAPADLLAWAMEALSRMFGSGFIPQPRYTVKQLLLAPAMTAALIGFGFWLIRGEATGERKITLALLVAPVLSVAFYFNSYPYFYSFILPPVAVGLAIVLERATERLGMPLMCFLLVVCSITLWWQEPHEHLAQQRAFQSEVRSVFPEAVVYIDESGMISDYPRAVRRFASGWALKQYREKGEPTYSMQLQREIVPLLLTNNRSLANIFAREPVGPRLLAEDEATIRNNFIHHGGMIYVAGKTFAPQEKKREEYVAVPGTYRAVEGDIEVNGRMIESGDTVFLERRSYDFGNPGDARATLRWAAAGEPSTRDFTLADLFTDF